MIGVITCGGDCPGLNSVLYALHRVFGKKIVGIKQNAICSDRPICEVYDLSILPRHIINVGGTILGSIVESDLERYDPERLKKWQSAFKQFIKQSNIKELIVVAGDGGIGIMQSLCKEIDLPMIAIPKTIDNDIQGSDFSIGFHSVVEHVTCELEALAVTGASHKRLMIAEVMGRDAGYIGLVSGIAVFADAILIPEIPYNLQELCSFLKERYHEQNRGGLIVVSEGVQTPTGEYSYIQGKRYGGISEVLAHLIADSLNLPTRWTRLGHLQRGGTPMAFDRFLANQMASKAKEVIEQKKYNHIVVVQNNEVKGIPIPEPLSRKIESVTYFEKVARNLGIFLGDRL